MFNTEASLLDLATDPASAAVGAVVVAGRLCPDPVRAQSARHLVTLVEGCDHGDSGPARRAAGSIATLVEAASVAHPQFRTLLLAAERWMLHPGPDSAAELTDAAVSAAGALPPDLLRAMWATTSGLDAAVAEVVSHGIHAASDATVAALAEAAADVPVVWVARRCGVSRDALHRRIRETAPTVCC